MAFIGGCLQYTFYLVLLVAILLPIADKYGYIDINEIIKKIKVEQKPVENVINTAKKPEKESVKTGEIILTKAELAKYDGSNPDLPIYLAFLGKVFDVSSGAKHYGKGGGYSFFSGKDATKAYVSGDFTPKGLTDDIDDLPVDRHADFDQWLDLYSTQYVYIGKLQGTFYNSDGTPTDKLKDTMKKMEKAREMKIDSEKIKQEFPECNSEWNPDTGSRVWCSQRSGGISRNWVGVPRKFFTPGQKSYRCACVSDDRLGDGRLHKYPNCRDDASECVIIPESDPM